MNTRLQVEHPVTEEVFGVDLVALQLAVAEGRALPPEPPAGPRGHAVEVRLYAEDPADDYAPQTGTLRTFEVPTGPGLRTDSAVESGSVVTHFYDAMIAKVVAHGDDRAQAIRRLDDALRRTRVHGLTTNLALLRGALADEEFAAGRVHTALLGERLAAWTTPLLDDAAVQRSALAAALAQARAASTTSPVLARIPTAFRNVPSQPRTRRLRLGDEELVVEYRSERGRLVSDLADVVSVTTAPAGVPGREGLVVEVALVVDRVGETYRVAVGEATVDVDGPAGSVAFDVVPTFVDPADVVAEGSLLAPMPASVVKVGVEPGQQVAKGDVVVVLEAMKMQHTITAPTDGVVAELAVAAGQQVESGAVLAVVEGNPA
jgi:propionyl-CoA carboxylase alpha chain